MVIKLKPFKPCSIYKKYKRALRRVQDKAAIKDECSNAV
jgi:hypothetical protein